jgi:hypothetical protein
MNNCYKDLVGLRGVCAESAMIYDLADLGISLKSASKTVDSKWISGSQMVAAKIVQAWREVLNDVLLQGYEFRKVVCEKTIGSRSYLSENLTNGTGSFTLRRAVSVRRETQLYISHLVVNGTGNRTITITDGITTFTYTGTANSINVRKYFSEREVDVTIAYTSVNSGVLSVVSDGACGCCSDCDVYHIGSQNYGITMDVQEVCMKDEYLCRYSEILAEAAWYKAGALILKEAMDTDRVNDFLIMKEGNLAVNIAMLDSDLNIFKYDDKAFVGGKPNVADGKYQIALQRITRQVAYPKKGICSDCAGGSYNISLP